MAAYPAEASDLVRYHARIRTNTPDSHSSLTRPGHGVNTSERQRSLLPLSRAGRRASVVAIAVASAATAGLADAAPSGLATADLVWRGLAGALVPVFASRAMRWTWLLLASAASLFASGAMQVVGVIGLAVAGGSMAMRRRDETVGALVGALAVNALFHLDPVVGHGVPTLIALAACGPVLVSGYRYGTLGGRRLVRVGLRVSAVMLVAVVVVAGGSLLLARTSLERGVDAAGEGLHHARAGNTALALERFDRAEQALDRGATLVGGPWIAPARAVPLVGQHVAATDDLVRAGRDAVGAGSAASLVLGDETLTIQGGRVDLEAVAAAEEPLAEVLAGLDDALAWIEHTDTTWLLPPVAERIHHLRRDLVASRGSAETAMLATGVVPSMLGADDPRTYLVLMVNPAESPDLGGSVSNWALVSANDGQLDLVEMGRPTADLASVAASPDFPTVASAAAERFPQAGIGPVDGVVVMDPAAIAAVLSLSGPLDIPQLDRPLEPSELERFLLIDQFALFPDPSERDAVVEGLLRATFSRLLTESTPAPETIGEAFDRVVAEDRLLVWTPQPAEAQLLHRAGLQGGSPLPASASNP